MTVPGFRLLPRSDKPRRRGLTSVIDFGPDGFGWTGPRGVADLLDCAAGCIDFAKIYALNALLMPNDVVRQIVGLYRDAGVTPYSGGILFEYAHQRGEFDGFLAHVQGVGLAAIEISENYVMLSDAVRRDCIARCRDVGLSVIYEFGRKNPDAPLSVDHLEEVVSTALDCGVAHVIIEQSEIDLAARSAPQALDALAAKPWFDRILIEADPYRFPSQHVGLLRQFGAEVNLANIAAGQALRLEGLRRGVGRAVDYSILTAEEPAR